MLRPCTTLVIGLGAALVGSALAQAPQRPVVAAPDTAKVADNIINHCASIREGDLVLITGSARDQQLLEDIAVEVRQLGAHPLITIHSDRLTRRLLADVNERYDAQEPAFQAKLAEIVDAVISVDYAQDLDLLADVPAKRLAARMKAIQPIESRMLERGVVSVNLGNGLYPSDDLAKQFGISYDDLSRIFWAGVNADTARLQATAARVTNILAQGREVKITAPNGTDLTLGISQRPVFASDGVITQEERYAGGPACQLWLPAGEVYLAPVPGTAQGTFVADTFFYEGKLIEGLTLKFAAGKLTSITAKKDPDLVLLRQRYDAAPAGKDLFGGLDLGINAAVKAPAGSRLLSWVAAGNISVGVGNNTWTGGDNAVGFGLYAHLPNGSLSVDGKPLIENGLLLGQ